jgi:hypothetical protein|tara:strand:+ start:904 stop:1083 length:180 start_codon:yes stop_codon:yes gene_type:complete
MIPILNFVAIVLLIFVTSLIFIDMYNIKQYMETNENQLVSLVSDINYNNDIFKEKLKLI